MNINYEHLYRKYKHKYITLKHSNKISQTGGNSQINLQKGMCVKGHYNPLYKDNLTRIFEVCSKKDKNCLLVGNNNYVTLMNGTVVSIENFNKFYKVRQEGCPKKNTDWDTYSNPNIISLHVDNQGFFFNIGDIAANKLEHIHGYGSHNYSLFRIVDIYRSDNNKVFITITNVNNKNHSITLSSNDLKKNYYIAEPGYKLFNNYAHFSLNDIEGMQNILLK
jgi:hypothetical protein